MSGRNGPDIAAVYQLLTQVAAAVAGHDRKLDELAVEVAGLRGTVGGLRETVGGLQETVGGLRETVGGLLQTVAGLGDIVAGHDRKLDDLAHGLASLRETVTHYHSTVVGHGILYSEIEERVRRIERHLKLEPAGD
jgi:ABC-type transporter Mla subunit MlaD